MTRSLPQTIRTPHMRTGMSKPVSATARLFCASRIGESLAKLVILASGNSAPQQRPQALFAMTSCAEASYFLKNCPGADGNNDGVPCEQQWSR